MSDKKIDKKKGPVHEELDGLDIRINELGEVVSNFDITEINRFLDKHTTDKKRPDQPGPEAGGKVEE
ncbi:MAG: hypothetical protein RL386_534 [Bacteroidota bacterium]|jgi:hypothetical protein